MDNQIKVEIVKKGQVLFSGEQSQAREKVEDMICERLGFYPSLQESVDEDFQVYLHTDCYEDLSDDQLIQLERLRITEDGETATEAIERFLQIEFYITH